jgi:hypothetical protein
MFCPKCRSEYVSGITVCHDCGIDLIEVLPPVEYDYFDYIEVITTMNPGEVAVIKSILDNAGIVYLIPEENFTLVSPWVQPARILVQKEYVEIAKELLQDLDLNYSGTSGVSGQES